MIGPQPLTRGIAASTLLLWLVVAGCGKYGPPVRSQPTPPAAENSEPEDDES